MSFVASVAGAATSAVTKDVGREVGQAIGRPLDNFGSSASRSAAHGDINWMSFNYPPYVRLIHYDLSELPSTHTSLIRCLNMSFQLTTFICALNVFHSLIIVATLKAPARWLLQSLLHLLLLPMIALAVFYSGYRGIVEPDTALVSRFKAGQPTLAFVYFLLSIVPWGCINGLAQLADMHNYTDGSFLWVIIIIGESCLWLVNAILAGTNAVRVHHFNVYGLGTSSSGTHF